MNNTTGIKKYLQPKDMLLNAVHELAGLQKGRTVLCDTLNGLVNLIVTVYGEEVEYKFAVSDIGGSRSMVRITLESDLPNRKRLINHEFALLDYVLVDRAEDDLNEIGDIDRKIRDLRENERGCQ